MIRSLFLFVVFASMLNCQSQKTTDNTSGSTKTTATKDFDMKKVSLIENEYTQIPNTNLNIKFNSIIEDSRCPEDVNCVWAGLVIVELEVMTPSTRPRTIQLASMDFEGKDARKTENIYGYNITLEGVKPYPKKEDKSEKEKHQALITIEKENTTN